MMWRDLRILCHIVKTYLVGQWYTIVLGFVTATMFSLVSLATPYLI